MNQLLHTSFAALQRLLAREDGQDLVEYALLVALIAFACTAGMGTLANSINSAFNTVAAALTIA
jgi:pilus assembly protein Flp/PilA